MIEENNTLKTVEESNNGKLVLNRSKIKSETEESSKGMLVSDAKGILVEDAKGIIVMD
jgi:hypothetical protein